MRKAILSIILAVAVIGCFFPQAAKAENISQANEAYREGRYEEAAKLYETVLNNHPRASNLHYNLGNSYYRSGKMGQAILAYERALYYAPRDADSRHNLDYLRGLLEYRIQDKRNWYLRAGDHLLRYVTERETQILALGTYFLFALSWVFVLFFRRGMPWGWIRKGLFCITGLCLLLYGAKNIQTNVLRPAIVMAQEAEVRYGPSRDDQVAFRLGEGLKVYVIDRREDWSRILLTNREGGWVRHQQIAEVKA